MKIKNYNFGKMQIDGQEYTKDLIIWPDEKIQDNWWRKKGHLLQRQDIPKLLETKPEIVIIGTGYFGMMKIDENFRNMLKENNIKLISHKTGKAVEEFNKINFERKIVAAMHLTC
ncbi:MAG: MTH938/NDUFAF3 family protein [Candidatus Cloacimonadota bacterium]|nr:MTH938/NDUFAF3 family protein [Candidatus Cloacimonadota bacterium]